MIPRGQDVAAAPWGGADYHEQILMSEFVFRVFLKEEQHLFGQPLSPMVLLYEFPIDKLYSLSWCSLVRTNDNYIKCSLYYFDDVKIDNDEDIGFTTDVAHGKILF